MVLEQAARLSDDPIVRFAALTHDLGKGTTPPTQWPRHVAHEQRSVQLIETMCQRLRIPNNYREIAVLVGRYHLLSHTLLELRAATLLELLENLDAFRRPVRLEQFILACEADARGRKGLEGRDYPQSKMLREARDVAAAVSPSEADRAGLAGPAIAAHLRKARIAALEQLRKISTEGSI